MDASRAAAERLGALAGRLRLLVRHLAGRRLCARVEVDDVVQETLLRVLATGESAFGDLDDAELWRYVARAARNTVVDLARAMRRAGRVGSPPAAEWSRTRGFDPPAATRGVLTRVAEAEGAATLERAYAALSPEHRRVIGLRQFEGLSAEAAGRRMGRSPAAIHSLYRRALQAWAAAAPPD